MEDQSGKGTLASDGNEGCLTRLVSDEAREDGEGDRLIHPGRTAVRGVFASQHPGWGERVGWAAQPDYTKLEG
jgi:hypothetical protein